MNSSETILFTIGLVMALTPVYSDFVEIKDGSRLHGTIIEATDQQLKIETAYAGMLTIPLVQVVSFSTEKPVFVRLQSGTTVLGAVKGDPSGNIAISGNDGTLTTQTNKVTSAWQTNRQDPEIAKREAEIAKMQRRWKYEANLDINGKNGNTEKMNIGAGFKATLASPHDLLKIYANYDYAVTKNQAGKNEASADEIKAGIEYNSYFYQDLGWYARTELERDEFENIKLRSTSALGLTYRFRNTDTHKLNGRAGFSFRHDSYDVVAPGGKSNDQKPGLDFGLNNDWTFATWGRIVTDLSYTPSFDDTSDFLFVHDSGLEMPLVLSQFWVFRLGVNNSYNSKPTDNREKMDTTYYTKLILKWE